MYSFRKKTFLVYSTDRQTSGENADSGVSFFNKGGKKLPSDPLILLQSPFHAPSTSLFPLMLFNCPIFL